MSRTALALVLAGAALAAGAPAAPAAPAAVNRVAGVDLELVRSDGTSRRVDLRVTSALRLTLQVSECDGSDCVGFAYYEARLEPGAVTLDPDEARGSVRTVVGGRALEVAWAPSGQQGVVLGGTEGSSSDEGEAASSYVAEPAVATVTWGGSTCELAGLVGDELRVESPEGNPGAALPLSRFRGGGSLAC